MNTKRILSSIVIGAGAIIIGLGLQYALAAWTSAPTGTPPNCPAGYPGCDAPINVSTSTQTKNGPLTLNFAGIQSIGLKVLGNIQMVDGNQGQGKVLMSDANGVATWVSTSSLGIVGNSSGSTFSHTVIFDSPRRAPDNGLTWTVPGGVTMIRVHAVGGGGLGDETSSACYEADMAAGGNPIPGSGGTGGYAESTVSVTPGTSYTGFVGNGGKVNANDPSQNDGGTSSFGSLVSATGGSHASGCNGIGHSGHGTIGQITSQLPPVGYVYNGYGTYGAGGGPASDGSDGVVIVEY